MGFSPFIQKYHLQFPEKKTSSPLPPTVLTIEKRKLLKKGGIRRRKNNGRKEGFKRKVHYLLTLFFCFTILFSEYCIKHIYAFNVILLCIMHSSSLIKVKKKNKCHD